MSHDKASSNNSQRGDQCLLPLAALAALGWLLYLAITLSAQSLHVADSGDDRLLGLLALFACAFGIYLVAIPLAMRARQGPRLLVLIVSSAILFRVTMLVSNPVEEIDLYRYLWDGAVVTQGVSPFRYSPQQVLAASPDTSLPDDLSRLVGLRDSSPAMSEILTRIHFGELPTIYPPVGQAVFALSAWLTPQAASLWTRLVLMKAWFVVCDVLTLLLVIRLLRLTRRPVGLALVYAWCPLLIKEISNSGHLDSLAFLLTTLAACFAIQALYAPTHLRSPQCTVTLAAAALALAVGAKLYPLVLVPLFLISIGRRIGWAQTISPAIVFGLIVSLLAWPMWPTDGLADLKTVAPYPTQSSVPEDDAPPLPPAELVTAPRDPSESLRAFLSEWEMNDFLFLLVIENLRPTNKLPADEVPWFSIVPDVPRQAIVSLVERHLGIEARRVPFLLTRGLTTMSFLLIAAALAYRAGNSSTASEWLSLAFLTVAWFWLLLPTLNPWYWTWVLPFLPFARSRVWWLLSGLAFLYYVRFWLLHQFSDTQVLGTRYNGPLFFDYVVVWLEFGPWFALLLASSLGKLRIADYMEGR